MKKPTRASPKKLTIDNTKLRVLPEDELAIVTGGDGEGVRRVKYRRRYEY